MEKITVVLRNDSAFSNPEYKTVESSGMDLRADLKRTFGQTQSSDKIQPIMNYAESPNFTIFRLMPGEIKVIKTGLFVEIPSGYEIQIRSRSGLSTQGIIVMNAPGTIDSDYRGEIGVILGNMSQKAFTINHGDRVAQWVLCPISKIDFITNRDIDETKRGTAGFGSTGLG